MSNGPPTTNEELISAYLDGELSGVDQERVETLLKEDDAIRQRYDELCALRETLQSLDS